MIDTNLGKDYTHLAIMGEDDHVSGISVYCYCWSG